MLLKRRKDECLKENSYSLIILVFISLAIVSVVGYFSIQDIKEEIFKVTKKDLVKIFNLKMEAKKDVGISNAVAIANNYYVIEALKKNDPNIALRGLKKLSDEYRRNTKFKNIKIHIHTADVRSFLRLWKPNKRGDDLSSFRKTIVWVRENKKAVVAIEVGKAGLGVRGVAPVMVDGKYLGSVEFIQGLNSISKDLLKDDVYVIIALDKKYLSIAKALKNAPTIMDNFVVALKEGAYSKEFFQDLKNKKFSPIIKDKNFFVVSIPIKDFEGNVVGYAFVGKSMKDLAALIDKNVSSTIKQIVIFVVIDIIMILVLMFVVSKAVIKPLTRLDSRIRKFADDLKSDKVDLNQRMDVESNDEIGNIAKHMNMFLDEFQNIINKQVSVINEIKNNTSLLTKDSKEMSSSISHQNEFIETTNSSVNEIEDNIEVTKDSIDKTSKNVDLTYSVLEEGTSSLNEVISNIENYANSEMDLVNRVTSLADQTTQIKEVILIIKEIADQTNLLALNAAIEAARAGEHGRGFAVVAEEVRKLAEKTQKSLGEIDSAVNLIVQGVEEIKEEIVNNSQNLENITETTSILVEKINETMENLRATVEYTKEAAKEVENMQKRVLQLSKVSDGLRDEAKVTTKIAVDLKKVSDNITKTIASLTKEISKFY